ncbi:MAG TPA: hypothetical protein VLB46_01490 [Pyrinomonadaceae bacterium]|nr:hypothetical protein [Pyrinomonadaceae bacterium]
MITAGVVAILLFVHRSETVVELDLATSEISFTLPTQQVLTEAMQLSSLGASGLREIELPDIGDAKTQTLFPSEDEQSFIQLSLVPGAKEPSSINLATLILPAQTRVTLRHYERPHQYRLSLTGSDLEFRTDVTGSLRIALPKRGVEQFRYATPQAVHLRAGSGEADLDLTFADTGRGNVVSHVTANDLSFLHVDEFQERERTHSRLRSTILSGSIIFEDLNGVELKVRPGEMIQFQQAEGHIRSLELQNDHLMVKYYGRVRGLTSGLSENRPWSLMPSWFEWLRARTALALFIGGSVSIFSFLYTLLGWWKVKI